MAAIDPGSYVASPPATPVVRTGPKTTTEARAPLASQTSPVSQIGQTSQTGQSFRSLLALAQQRSTLGLSGWSGSRNLGTSALGTSSLGFSGLESYLLPLTMGLNQAASGCPLCGNALSMSSLLTPSMIQAVQVVARDAVLQTLSQVAGWGMPSIVDLRTVPLSSQSRLSTAVPTTVLPPGAVSGGLAAPGVGAVGEAPQTAAVPVVGKAPMALSAFPKPEGDNGRGMHWVPTLCSPANVVDRFVKEAKDMHVKWMVFLNDGAKIGENDYLVKKLVEAGIMPVMRVYTDNGKPIDGDLGAMVRHYKALGVQYYQLYNEPNLNVENPEGKPDVDRYLDKWVKAARAVTEAGGLPGFGALSPGGNYDDLEFLKNTLDRLKERGEADVLDRAWLSLHNYTLNHPLDYTKDSNGFLKFKFYDQVVQEKLGRSMPIIGTEGGTFVGSAEDRTMPAITEQQQVQMVVDAYRYMKTREAYNFVYSYWIIANEEGGGRDRSFSHQALFKPNAVSPLVDALKRLQD